MRILAISSLVFAIIQSASAYADSFAVQLVDRSGDGVEKALVTLHPLNAAAAQPLPSDDLRMSQRNLQFEPGTLVVPVGSSVSFPNEDNTGHHVYSFSEARQFDLRIIPGGDSEAVQFDRAGTVAVGCNIHDAMIGFIHVVDTPWAQETDSEGRVQISDVPDGRYELRIWHARLNARGQQQTFEVELTEDRAIQIYEVDLRRARRRGGRY